MTKDNRFNNARLQTMGAYVPLYDIELVDDKQQIYRGKPYVQPEQREEVWPFIYYSGAYFPEINDFDKIYTPIELDQELTGVKVTLIPKEKLLFKYMPHTLIQLPAPGRIKMRRPQ